MGRDGQITLIAPRVGIGVGVESAGVIVVAVQ